MSDKEYLTDFVAHALDLQERDREKEIQQLKKSVALLEGKDKGAIVDLPALPLRTRRVA